MATHYQEVVKKNKGKPNAILRNVAKLYVVSEPPFEETALISEQKNLVTINRLAIKKIEKGGIC